MVATLIVHPRVMKIHKNLPGNISNIFSILKYSSLIEKLHSQIIFCKVATLMVHPRIMKLYKKFPGDITNNFRYQNIIALTNNFLYGGHPNGTP